MLVSEALIDALREGTSLSCTVYVLFTALGEGGLLVPLNDTLDARLDDERRLDDSGGVGGGVGEAEP